MLKLKTDTKTRHGLYLYFYHFEKILKEPACIRIHGERFWTWWFERDLGFFPVPSSSLVPLDLFGKCLSVGQPVAVPDNSGVYWPCWPREEHSSPHTPILYFHTLFAEGTFTNNSYSAHTPNPNTTLVVKEMLELVWTHRKIAICASLETLILHFLVWGWQYRGAGGSRDSS